MLSFKQLDNQFKNLCGCFIKLQHYCCSKKRSKTEVTLARIQNDHNKRKSPTPEEVPFATQLGTQVSEIP